VPDPLAVLGVHIPEAAPPELSARAELAAACWSFSDGWHPERWPLFAALHDVVDWHALVELMQAIRDATRDDHGRTPQVPHHR
jgi:hypothetical protein